MLEASNNNVLPAIPGKRYFTIGEVSDLCAVKPHVLRYWETQFGMLRPKKNRAGNRMYRPDEVKMLLGIKELLYHRRFTIAGARRRLLDERKDDAPQQLDLAVTEAAERKLLVHEIKTELKQLLGRLRGREPVRS